MRISGLEAGAVAFPASYDFEESYRSRVLSGTAAKEEAIEKVEQAKDANFNAALKVMDRHTDMVRKSQELNKVKAKRQAVERQNQKRREEQTQILAEMALRNAERRDLLEAGRLSGGPLFAKR